RRSTCPSEGSDTAAMCRPDARRGRPRRTVGRWSSVLLLEGCGGVGEGDRGDPEEDVDPAEVGLVGAEQPDEDREEGCAGDPGEEPAEGEVCAVVALVEAVGCVAVVGHHAAPS